VLLQKVWDFRVVRHFSISTGRMGLTSDFVQPDNRKICMPINQATEPEGQVQEFIALFHGAGVEHFALLTIRHRDCSEEAMQKRL
jgi:4-hydroxyphenylpyruvate dioxygenase-like putative hemolysin